MSTKETIGSIEENVRSAYDAAKDCIKELCRNGNYTVPWVNEDSNKDEILDALNRALSALDDIETNLDNVPNLEESIGDIIQNSIEA